ncbi:hypothetical protein ABN034_07750 [Actinopolymorpha sp. B11F2]
MGSASDRQPPGLTVEPSYEGVRVHRRIVAAFVAGTAPEEPSS